jgi:uncharacterized protein
MESDGPANKPWIMRQSWRDLLFAHWPVSYDALRRVVPSALEIDTFENTAWIAVVPFMMTGIRARLLPPLPGLSRSLEMNVRTYVRFGGRSGVYFFSLDAANRAVVFGGRHIYGLPYFLAAMSQKLDGDRIEYESKRIKGEANLRVAYEPISAVTTASTGSLEHWLTARYCLFTCSPEGRVSRANIHHDPWPLQPAVATFEVNTMTHPLGIELNGPPLLHFSKRVDVQVWPPEPVSL